MRLLLHQHDFTAKDFCRPDPAAAFPSHSQFANFRFTVNPTNLFGSKEKLHGPGIYAICYDQQLIYIGKYLGQKKNPFAGNIARLRWVQHIGSMTMRDRRVSLSKRSLDVLLDPNFSQRHNVLIRSLAQAFDNDRLSGPTKPFLQRDRGCLSTVNRVLFALEHWPLFSHADGPALEGFSFHYFRVERLGSELPAEGLRTLISTLEDRLVEAFRPPCNAIIDPGTALFGKRPQVLDDLGNEIRRTLSAEFDASSDGQSISKVANSTKLLERSSHLTEPEETSAELSFFERLEGAPSEAITFIEELRSYVSERDDVELHFTNAKSGDLRLRKHGLGKNRRGSQNFLTLAWQTREQKFRINNICPPPEDQTTSVLSSFFRPLLNDPLKSTIKIDAHTALSARKALMGWIEKGRMALDM